MISSVCKSEGVFQGLGDEHRKNASGPRSVWGSVISWDDINSKRNKQMTPERTKQYQTILLHTNSKHGKSTFTFGVCWTLSCISTAPAFWTLITQSIFNPTASVRSSTPSSSSQKWHPTTSQPQRRAWYTDVHKDQRQQPSTSHLPTFGQACWHSVRCSLMWTNG